MDVIVIDTETTGIDPEKDRIVEIGAVRVYFGKDGAAVGDTFSVLVNPEMPIPPYARAIHHISDVDVFDCPTFPQAMEELRAFCGKERFVVAAHNAAFDSAFFPKKSQWICTWRCARHKWPELESHSNQALRYVLPDVNDWIEANDPEKALPPHRALPDAWVTAHVVKKMLEDETPGSLLDLTGSPILLPTIRFGKHRGERFENLPTSYLSWLVKQDDMDPDVKFTADQHLRRK